MKKQKDIENNETVEERRPSLLMSYRNLQTKYSTELSQAEQMYEPAYVVEPARNSQKQIRKQQRYREQQI